ncbi:hypothetical protein KAR34_01420, partial [bacterium]|nr:hypothetical protein [bacterium]
MSTQVQDLAINKQLDAIAEYAKQVQPDLEKEWQGFTQKVVTEQLELKRTQKKFVSTVFLRTAWDAMEQKRKEWLDTVKQYADNKAQARLEIQLESYQLQLRDQVKQMDVKVRDKQAELSQKLDSVTEKLSAQADTLFANNHIGDVKQKVKEQFGEYKKAKQTFLAQAEKTKREVSDKIFRNEYFVYLKQADRMDQVLMEAVDKKTRHLQYALLGLEKGQARKEMEMFATSSRKRLSRETEKLKNKIVGAGFTLARQITAGAGFVDPKNVGAGFTPALKDWQVLQDIRYLHKQAVALKTTLPQQSKALQKSLAACEVIEHLEKYGDIEQQLKMHTNGFARPYTGDLYQLSSQRRQLIKHIQNLADQGAQQIKKADIAQFAARLNAFGEKINRRGGVSPPTNRRGRVYPCPDFRFNPETFQQSGEKFWKIAQDQAEYFIDAQKTLNMHRKLTEIQSVQQQATDMLQQKIQKTTQLAQLREYVSQVKAVENTLARVQESETQLVQMDLRETRFAGLQKKTKEYHASLQNLGKKLSALPEPVQKEWKHLEAKAQAAGKDFITSEWKTLKKDMQGKLDQEIGKLDTQKKVLAQTYKIVDKIIPVGNGRNRRESQNINILIRSGDRSLLIQNPNTAIMAKWQSLQKDLTNQAEQFSQNEIQKIMGLKPKDLNKQVSFAQNYSQQELASTLETIKQGVFSSQTGAQLKALSEKQGMVWHTLETNMNLLQQTKETGNILMKLDPAANAEIGMKNILALYRRGALRAPVTQYNTQNAPEKKQITQVINEFKKTSLNREKISTTLNMVSKGLVAQIRSNSSKLNSAEIESIAVGALFTAPKEMNDALNKITKLATSLTPDLSAVMQELDFAANMLEVNRRLNGTQERLANAAQDILAGRAPPEWNTIINPIDGKTEVGALLAAPVDNILDNAISNSIDFIRQQAVRTQVQRALDQVTGLGNQAEALLNNHITDIQDQLAEYGFIDMFNVVGANLACARLLGMFARQDVGPIMSNLNLDEMAKQFSLAGAQQKIFGELQKLQNTQEQFAGEIQRQLLEIQRADAAVVMDLVAKKYQHLSQEFQQAWETLTYQVDPTHWSFDPAFNFANPGQFQLDQQ